MNRGMTIAEFLEKLQKEFICAEIRSLIYAKDSDKRYWNRVMDGKEEKINDICGRNNLRNIFDSDEIRKRVWAEVLGESGLPNFIYKDDDQRLGDGQFPGMEERDIKCYYYPDTEVRIGGSVNYQIGIIDSLDYQKRIVKVRVGDKVKPFEFEKVTRIL